MSTDLSASEFATLAALPAIVDAVLQPVICELASGHQGSHVAFTVASAGGECWWWLRWGADPRTIVEIDPCDHTETAGAQGDDCCLLPQRHPGPHSFDIRPAQRRPSASVDL